jgi:hypothetical protein
VTKIQIPELRLRSRWAWCKCVKRRTIVETQSFEREAGMVSIRVLMFCVCCVLFPVGSHAQQIGSYPSEKATIDPGAYVCRNEEALRQTLTYIDYHREYGGLQYVPILKSCFFLRAAAEVKVLFSSVFEGKNFSADILIIEFLTTAGERFFVQGEEQILLATL